MIGGVFVRPLSDVERRSLFRAPSGARPNGPWTCERPDTHAVFMLDGRAVAAAGMLVRSCSVNRRTMICGGIGYTSTLKEWEGHGLATIVQRRALYEFRKQGLELALLTCIAGAKPFWESRGWVRVQGSVWMRQPGVGRMLVPPQVSVLFYPLSGDWSIYDLDLRGLPW